MARGFLEIDCKRIELTNEQVEQLLKEKEEVKKNPFDRVEYANNYHYITSDGFVATTEEDNLKFDNMTYNVANYCTDIKLMEQRALHEILDRLLWRFSMENDGDKIDWNDEHQIKWYVLFNHKTNYFYVNDICNSHINAIYFHTKKIALRAIEKIIEPFMKEHPEFVW